MRKAFDWILALTLLLAPASSFAQTFGQITGLVTDTTGGVLVGARQKHLSEAELTRSTYSAVMARKNQEPSSPVLEQSTTTVFMWAFVPGTVASMYPPDGVRRQMGGGMRPTLLRQRIRTIVFGISRMLLFAVSAWNEIGARTSRPIAAV